jgi:cardiolipin synthase A/B
MPWIIAGVAGLVGVVWYFVLRFGSATDSDAARAQIAVEEAKEHAERPAAAARVVHADLARSWAPTTANDVEVMPEGKTFYPRMLADIVDAQSSIHIMQYGFNPGVIGDQFTPVLEQKARDGVKVRIILDALGSHAWFGTKNMLNSLAAAGVEVMLHDAIPPDRRGPVGERHWSLTANQFGRVEHRKLVLVDGATAYVGGAGIEDHFADGRFHDVYIRFTGPVTRQLQAIFLDSIRYHGGTLPAGEGALDHLFPPVPEPGAHRVTILMNWPRGWRPYTEAAFRLVRESTSKLEMTNPYIGDPRMIADIIDAGRRGVAVRLLVSDEAHGGIAAAAFKHHYDALLDAGVQVWEYPALVHAKVILSDDRALVGTLNLDAWAMYRNPELGLLFEDASVADQFRRVMIDPDVVVSTAGAPASGSWRRVKNRILARASYLF